MNRCLFLDDWHIGRADGLELRAHPAQRYAGNPLMVKKYPWEAARLQLLRPMHCLRSRTKALSDVLYFDAKRYALSQPEGGAATKVGHVTVPSYPESTMRRWWLEAQPFRWTNSSGRALDVDGDTATVRVARFGEGLSLELA